MAYEPTPFDQYTTFGLDQAKNLFNQMATPPSYPSQVSQNQQAPVQMGYYDYTPSATMQQVAAPNYTASGGAYQGLMGGDYNRLEQSLAQPGQLAAQQGYDTGLRNLQEVFGGRGLYGSTMMGNQMNEGLMREYMNALSSNASNAAAKRYSMEQSELASANQFNMNREQSQNQFAQQGFQTGAAHSADLFKAQQAEAQRQQTYSAGQQAWNYQQQAQQRDWQNNQAYEQFTYKLAQQAYDQQMKEAQMNRALAIAGQGSPLSQSYLNYQIAQQQAAASKDAASQMASAQTNAALYGAVGSGAGGLLGGDLGNSIWDYITK